jgi:hypothetical protein
MTNHLDELMRLASDFAIAQTDWVLKGAEAEEEMERARTALRTAIAKALDEARGAWQPIERANSGWGMDFSAPVDASAEDGERIRNEVMSAALSGGMYRPTIRVVGESKWWPQKPADDEPPATAGKEQ